MRSRTHLDTYHNKLTPSEPLAPQIFSLLTTPHNTYKHTADSVHRSTFTKSYSNTSPHSGKRALPTGKTYYTKLPVGTTYNYIYKTPKPYMPHSSVGITKTHKNNTNSPPYPQGNSIRRRNY